MDKDIIVIGGGPGGYVAAIRAAQLGSNVCLTEMDKVGGTCLNRGCIPTKALWRNAEILNTLKHIKEFGIEIDGYRINVEEVQNRKQKVVDQLVSGIEKLLDAYSVEVINGTASLKDKNTVVIAMPDGSVKEMTAKNIIIATGSKTTLPPIEGVNLDGVLTSDEILNFKEIPNRLSVIGGGVIAMEFAGIFAAMGSAVTVVNRSNILKRVDSDIVKRFSVSVKKKGVDLITECSIEKIEKRNGLFYVIGENKKGKYEVEAEALLVATGREPVLDGINLEGLGIEYSKKGIKVDANYETNVSGIYAIGDVNGLIMLAHAASHQGISVAEKIHGMQNHSHSPVPDCIFVFPEISTVGMTEDEAKEKGISYQVSKFMFGANGKALSLGEGEGFVKVLSNEQEEIIGVHIMGPHASDLIHEGTLAVSTKLKIDAIKNTIHAHPTLSEAFHEAVCGLKGEAIHMVQARK
ncbi:MAG: dihydrolipoyl dehydrogenase [Clostridiales bacterium GWB2_37_7]|nr:MAG: dihydrolipoyl dehydrogenase [Clostridiales bacterium GWB2_37_7]